MNLYKLPSIPSNEKVLFDTNIFVYSALDHPEYGESCTQAFQRVESKEIIRDSIHYCPAMHILFPLQKHMGYQT